MNLDINSETYYAHIQMTLKSKYFFMFFIIVEKISQEIVKVYSYIIIITYINKIIEQLNHYIQIYITYSFGFKCSLLLLYI